jgi:hypothetical protein
MIGICGKQWIPPSSLKFALPPFTFQVLFGVAGMLAYMTFGDKIQAVILINLDRESKMVQAMHTPLPHSRPSLIYLSQTQVQSLYSLAILLSVPLQFLAMLIMENGLFISRGESRHLRQMAEECIQVLRGHALFSCQLGGRCGPG